MLMSTAVALDDAMRARLAAVDNEDAQFGLFGPPATIEGERRAARRGPGRPVGARNKHTERSVAILLAQHRDPRAVLLEIAESNVHDLAALYRCSELAAAVEKRLAATAVLPYIAARQPLAVDLTNRNVVYLTIVDGQADGSTEAGIGAVAAVVDSVEYHQLLPPDDSAAEG